MKDMCITKTITYPIWIDIEGLVKNLKDSGYTLKEINSQNIIQDYEYIDICYIDEDAEQLSEEEWTKVLEEVKKEW